MEYTPSKLQTLRKNLSRLRFLRTVLNKTLNFWSGCALNKALPNKERMFCTVHFNQHLGHLYRAVVFVLNDDKRANFHSTDIGIYRRNINKFDCNAQVSNVLSHCLPVHIKVVTLFISSLLVS